MGGAKEWRTWSWAREAFIQARKARTSLVLVHVPTILEKETTIREHVFYRFGITPDDSLYEGRIPMDESFTIGSCWLKKSSVAGQEFISDGIKGKNETITIYIHQE